VPTVIKDMSTRGAWSPNATSDAARWRILNELTRPLDKGACPIAPDEYGYEITVVDGFNGGVPSGMPSERTEFQAGRYATYGQWAWYRWAEWFDPNFAVPAPGQVWCIAVAQWHGSASGGQPYMAFEIANINGVLYRVINANYGSSTRRWIVREPLNRGMWREWRIGVTWHMDPAQGRIIVRSGARELYNRVERTAWAAEVPYMKTGGYRTASISGPGTMRVAGFKVWDGDPGPFLATMPPPPDDIDVVRAELEATKLELAKTEDRLEKAIVMIESARSTLDHDV